MYCTNCGSPVEDGQIFCTACGQKLEVNPLPAGNPAASAPETMPQNTSAYSAAYTPQTSVSRYSGSSGKYAAPSQSAPGYSYGTPAAQQPAQNDAYTAAQAGQPPVPNYTYGPAETKTAAFNWERLEPRSRPAGAGALIFALGILFAAVFLMVWGTAFISPGGLGSGEAVASQETKKPASTSAGKETKEAAETTGTENAGAPTAAVTEAPPETTLPETAPGELPAAIAAKVNKSAAREDYYGQYSGTLTVETYDLAKLAEASGAPTAELEMYEAISGQNYAVTAEYKEGNRYIKVVSNEFPYTKPGEAILEAPVKEAPADGCTVQEQVMEADGYTLKNSQQVWFLSDGSLYLLNAITASKGEEFVGGMIISALLKPVQ